MRRYSVQNRYRLKSIDLSEFEWCNILFYSGCKSTSMSEPSCDSDPVEPYNGMVKCETNEDAYHNYDALTLHTTWVLFGCVLRFWIFYISIFSGVDVGSVLLGDFITKATLRAPKNGATGPRSPCLAPLHTTRIVCPVASTTSTPKCAKCKSESNLQWDFLLTCNICMNNFHLETHHAIIPIVNV